MALLHGDTSGLASGNHGDVKKLCDLAIGTDVEERMIEFASSEAEYEFIKRKLQQNRQQLADAMLD